ncbi:MAG: DegV family protein [Candidatus Paceibacterota bacterium]
MEILTHQELKKMFIFSAERLERDKENVNKINVFPVPDQDTGTNLAATLKGIKDAIQEKDFDGMESFGAAALDAALTAAQGNTGIIYTGFLAGFILALDNQDADAKTLGNAFYQGYERAKDSIQNPKEGTILDVIRAFAETFSEYAKKETDLVKIFSKAFKSANTALMETPEKMELLKKAGVVDAGGLGFLMILETYLDILSEQTDSMTSISSSLLSKEESATRKFVQILSNRYEVVALMRRTDVKENEIRNKLKYLGNCLDIIQVGERTKIHIHTDDPYEVRDIISKMGAVENLRLQDMAMEIVGAESVLKDVSIGIVIDERAGLSQKIIQHYDIEVIPFRINWPEEQNLAGENVCEKIKEAKKKGLNTKPTINPISPEFFMESFKKQLEKFESVLAIVSSSKLSNNYNSALKAREMLPWNQKEKVYIIDSYNISAGQSLVVLEAIELIREQRKIKEVVSRLQNIIPNIRFYGIFENSRWWKKEKQPARMWFQKEEPKKDYLLIEKRSGRIVPVERVKSEDFASVLFNKIERLTRHDLLNGKKIRVVIAHGDNLEEADKLKTQLKTTKKADISFISITDPVTSINACPHSLFVGWILK